MIQFSVALVAVAAFNAAAAFRRVCLQLWATTCRHTLELAPVSSSRRFGHES